MFTTAQLRAAVPFTGKVTWIGLSSGPRGTIRPVEIADCKPGTGLEGDHHARSGRSHRQVTLIQAEHLAVVGRLLGREMIDPALLRRNIVVEGVNLHALRKALFRIGDVLLEGTGNCDPCSRMHENLGDGGYTAMLGHGGITARVLEGGFVRVGDPVAFVGLGPHPQDETDSSDDLEASA